jgi:hypothetical protein
MHHLTQKVLHPETVTWLMGKSIGRKRLVTRDNIIIIIIIIKEAEEN